MKRVLIIVGSLLLIALIVIYLLPKSTNEDDLTSQEKYLTTMEMPDKIERIVVRSAIGDSGTEVDYNTLRSVMLVKTDLSKAELTDAFVNLGFYDKGGTRNWDYPSFVVREAINYQFRSPNDFRLEFEELKYLDELNGYFYIEFIK